MLSNLTSNPYSNTNLDPSSNFNQTNDPITAVKINTISSVWRVLLIFLSLREYLFIIRKEIQEHVFNMDVEEGHTYTEWIHILQKIDTYRGNHRLSTPCPLWSLNTKLGFAQHEPVISASKAVWSKASCYHQYSFASAGRQSQKNSCLSSQCTHSLIMYTDTNTHMFK